MQAEPSAWHHRSCLQPDVEVVHLSTMAGPFLVDLGCRHRQMNCINTVIEV